MGAFFSALGGALKNFGIAEANDVKQSVDPRNWIKNQQAQDTSMPTTAQNAPSPAPGPGYMPPPVGSSPFPQAAMAAPQPIGKTAPVRMTG